MLGKVMPARIPMMARTTSSSSRVNAEPAWRLPLTPGNGGIVAHPVAQTCSLLYRRFSICVALVETWTVGLILATQAASLRYSPDPNRDATAEGTAGLSFLDRNPATPPAFVPGKFTTTLVWLLPPTDHVVLVHALIGGLTWIDPLVGPRRPHHHGTIGFVDIARGSLPGNQTIQACLHRCRGRSWICRNCRNTVQGILGLLVIVQIQRNHVGISPRIAIHTILSDPRRNHV